MLRWLFLYCSLGLAGAQTMRELHVPSPLPEGSTLILGFLGGIERWNDPNRGVRKVALGIRELHLHDVYVETLGNRRHKEARKLILNALDVNRNKKIDPNERGRIKLKLYGQSLGGGEVVKLARQLQKWKVPVELTVQVDSVALRDGEIPENVRYAANFYQKELLTIWGQDRIVAADPAKTKILGNFRYRYPIWMIHTWPETNLRRIFGGGHARMEADPVLWAQVQGLLLAPPELAKVVLESIP